MYCKSCTDLIRKYEENGSTCDRSRPRRRSILVEAVAEIHKTLASMCFMRSAVAEFYGPQDSAPCSSRVSVLISACPDVASEQAGDKKQRSGFANEFHIRYDEDGYGFYAFCGRTRLVSR